jgi:hypothetical protein
VLEERIAVSDFAEDDHGRRISRLRKPQGLNPNLRPIEIIMACEAGHISIGKWG